MSPFKTLPYFQSIKNSIPTMWTLGLTHPPFLKKFTFWFFFFGRLPLMRLHHRQYPYHKIDQKKNLKKIIAKAKQKYVLIYFSLSRPPFLVLASWPGPGNLLPQTISLSLHLVLPYCFSVTHLQSHLQTTDLQSHFQNTPSLPKSLQSGLNRPSPPVLCWFSPGLYYLACRTQFQLV